MTPLEKAAAAIPSMGGRHIGHILRRHAAEVLPGRAIVELGVFLGSGTAQLALGLRDSSRPVEIHCYDRFETRAHEKHMAEKEGVKLASHEDTVPRVQASLAPFGVPVVLHKGDIRLAKWKGPQIGMHVDDACKREPAFTSALRTFSPWWVPGETVVVLMDFYYFTRKPGIGLEFQYNWMHEHARCFQQIDDEGAMRRDADSERTLSIEGSTAVFRYMGGLKV